MDVYRGLILIGLIAAALVLAGCGKGPTVPIRYDRPAKWDIPTCVQRVGIAPFQGKTPRDRRWGDIASDQLMSELHECNCRYNRYVLVDRKRLKQIMDEKDLQMAIADTATASRVGKIANVDAVIYGTVHVSTKDESASRRVFDPLSRSLKEKRYTKRFCQVAVNFTMDDIKTGTTLATEAEPREYNSEDDEKAGGIGKALGIGAEKLPPTEKVIAELVDRAVTSFAAGISPHRETFTETLAGSTSRLVRDGHEFAESSEWADALRCYQQAIQANCDDHGAVFNAGVMCEVMGELKKAEQYYDQAVRLEPKGEYIAARGRVRRELARQP